MTDISEARKDGILKFYSDYLLVRIFRWDAGYYPYKLVQPHQPQEQKLANLLGVSLKEMHTYIRSDSGKKELLEFAVNYLQGTYKGDIKVLLRWPDKVAIYLNQTHPPITKATDATRLSEYQMNAILQFYAYYALAHVFHLDRNSGAPYRVMVPQQKSLSDLSSRLGISEVGITRIFQSTQTQERFVRFFEQEMKHLYLEATEELTLYPVQTAVRYTSDFGNA